MRSCVRFGSGLVLALSAIIIAYPGTAAAQAGQPAPVVQATGSVAEPNTLTLTPFLSGLFGASQDVGGSVGLGVAVGYDLTRNLGFEGEIAHAFDVLGDDDNLDWPVTNYTVNGAYQFDLQRFTPYATIGLGVEHDSRNVKTPDPAASYPASSTEVAVNFGGGVKYPVTERFVARADLRRFQSTDLSPDFWRLYAGLTFWVKR
jgi:opacity protein-like surface antigen